MAEHLKRLTRRRLTRLAAARPFALPVALKTQRAAAQGAL